jgi:ribosomal protein S18 acetylase RimI-like enzyme
MSDPLMRLAGLTPIAVLSDRSRDAVAWPTVVEIEPHHVFRVTDNRRRLTRRRLEAYDVVVVAAHGTAPYSKAEREAVRAFVERGGTLVLAASAGLFEASTGLPVRRLAVDGLAREFGFRFLTAAGYPRRNQNLPHARRRDLEITAAGRRIGLDRDGTRMLYPAPIEAPSGATVLLREKGTRAPVFARARVGRGLVVVYGEPELFCCGWSSFGAALHLAAHAPRRRTAAARPPRLLDVPRETLVDGPVTVIASPFARPAADRVLRLARLVLEELRRELRPPDSPDRLVLHLEPGADHRPVPAGGKEMRVVLGADLDDAGVVTRMLRYLVFRHLMPWWGRHRPFPAMEAVIHLLRVRLLEKLGLDEAAAVWRAYGERDEPGDAGTWYSEGTHTPAPVRRLLLDLDERFGKGTLRRLCRALPGKKPFEAFPDLTSQLDRLAVFLARDRGEEVYDWLEERGHTVRRLPLEEPGSESFTKAVDRWLGRRLVSAEEPLSERLRAARDLAQRWAKEKRLLSRARGEAPERALPAAIAFARSRDERCREILEAWTRSDDPGLAAIAALHAVSELGSRAAADRLVVLAEKHGDTAFRLAAGNALRSIGDERADRFSFERLPGCEFRFWRNSQVRGYAVVDGREVAVVVAGPMLWARGYGRTSSRSYVFWVHTTGPYRRMGIAGRLFDAALRALPWSGATSEIALHAMSDYFAHALYRDRGLVDSNTFLSLSKDAVSPVRRAPKGIRIRLATPEDGNALADLARRVHESRIQPNARPPRGDGPETACVATEGKTLRGVLVTLGGDLREFAVDPSIEDAKRRERVALALLAFAERRQKADGEESLTARTIWRYDDEDHVRWLQRAGFSSKPHPLVEQSRVRDLARFLTETEGVLEARLAAAELPARRVVVALDGGEPGLRATLRIDGTRVRVSPGVAKGAGIVVRGEAEAIQRVVFAMADPFDELNQTRLAVEPTPNGATRKLLGALFPCHRL